MSYPDFSASFTNDLANDIVSVARSFIYLFFRFDAFFLASIAFESAFL